MFRLALIEAENMARLRVHVRDVETLKDVEHRATWRDAAEIISSLR